MIAGSLSWLLLSFYRGCLFCFLFVVLPPLFFFLSLFLSLSLSIFLSLSTSPKFINLLLQLSQSLVSQACTAMIHHAGLIYMHVYMYTHVFRVLRMEPKASCLVLCHWVTLKSLPCVFRKEDSQVTYSLSEAKKGIIYKAAAAAIPHAAQVNVQGSNWFDALYFKPIPTAFKRTEGFKAMWIPGASLWCHITNTHHLNEGWRRGVIRFFFFSWMFLH